MWEKLMELKELEWVKMWGMKEQMSEIWLESLEQWLGNEKENVRGTVWERQRVMLARPRVGWMDEMKEIVLVISMVEKEPMTEELKERTGTTWEERRVRSVTLKEQLRAVKSVRSKELSVIAKELQLEMWEKKLERSRGLMGLELVEKMEEKRETGSEEMKERVKERQRVRLNLIRKKILISHSLF